MAHSSKPGNGGRRHTEPQGPSSFQLQQQPTSSVNARSRLSVASGTGTPAKTSKHEQKHMDMTTGRMSAREVAHLSSSLRHLFSSDATMQTFESQFHASSGSGSGGVATFKTQRSEIDTFYRNIKFVNCLQRAPARRPIRGGSVSSNEYGSTLSSTISVCTDHSDQTYPAAGAYENFEDWSMRWAIDSVGKAPGQLRGPKGVCILQNGGNVVVADSKNARLQVFSGSSGKLLGVFGDDSSEQHIATTFNNMTHRKMEPTGLCELPDGSLLAVTDHNRLIYVDVTAKHNGLHRELIIPGQRQLSGVAVTQGNKLILTEIGTAKPSVGVYENDGRLIRAFKGDFRSPAHVAWNEYYGLSAVSDGEHQSVMLYDVANGKQIRRLGNVSFSSDSVVPTPFGYPSGICWFDANRLLVADRSENSVMAIDLRNFSIMNVLDDQSDGLRQPVSIATNGSNRVVLTEEFYDFGVDEFKMKMFRLMIPRYVEPASHFRP